MSRSSRRYPGSESSNALRVLAADLRDLALDLQAGTYTRTTVAMFHRDLRQAVPSALGATVAFDLDTPCGIPKKINLLERALDPLEIVAGLRIPLVLPQQSLRGSILFYASDRGAFDDIVKKLLTLLGLDPGLVDRSPTLPTGPISPSVVNVDDFSVVNDALGVLINRGDSLTEARTDLQDGAVQAQTGLPGAARTLLDGLPTRRGRRAMSLDSSNVGRGRPGRPDGGAPSLRRTPEQRRVEDEGLAASLHGLSVLSADRLPLADMLTRVARYAVQAIPGADGAGLTLIEPHRSSTIVTTAAFVAKIDAAQHGLGEGPSISAVRDRCTVISGSLGGDPRWPRFGTRATRTGVHSALSLPLTTPDEIVGVISIYAHAKHVLDERGAQIGELFAAPAAIAVQNARALEDTRRLTTRLQTALDERMVVERAIGIVMSRTGVDETEAHARLTRLSQHEHVKLIQIAHTLVEEAVRRARTRSDT